MSRKKRNRYLDDLSRAILNHLMKQDGFGYSYDVIAAMAFRKQIEKVTPAETNSVAGYFRRNGHSVLNWRYGLTVGSRNFILGRSKLPKKRVRRPRRRRLRAVA